MPTAMTGIRQTYTYFSVTLFLLALCVEWRPGILHQSQGPGIVNLNARVSPTQLACFHLFYQDLSYGLSHSVLAKFELRNNIANMR